MRHGRTADAVMSCMSAWDAGLGIANIVNATFLSDFNPFCRQRLLEIEHIENAEFVALCCFAKRMVDIEQRLRRVYGVDHQRPPVADSTATHAAWLDKIVKRHSSDAICVDGRPAALQAPHRKRLEPELWHPPVANVENNRSISSERQCGHRKSRSSSCMRRSISKLLPQLRHW